MINESADWCIESPLVFLAIAWKSLSLCKTGSINSSIHWCLNTWLTQQISLRSIWVSYAQDQLPASKPTRLPAAVGVTRRMSYHITTGSQPCVDRPYLCLQTAILIHTRASDIAISPFNNFSKLPSTLTLLSVSLRWARVEGHSCLHSYIR
jgi:hypothetical protein